MQIFRWVRFIWALIKLYPTIKALWVDAMGGPDMTAKDFEDVAKKAILSGLKTADGQTIIPGLKSDGSV